MENMIGAVMDQEKSILNISTSCKRIAEIITRRLMLTRSAAQPKWRPYVMQEGLRASDGVHFDGKKFYPASKTGDVAYVAGDIWIEKDCEVWINVIGSVQVYVDGVRLVPDLQTAKKSVSEKKYMNYPVYLRAEKLHSLVVKVICVDDLFKFDLIVSPPRCAGLWANFYHVMARVVFPHEICDACGSLEKEEGMAVSPLYTGAASAEDAFERNYEFEQSPQYAFPRIEAEDCVVDFCKLYSDGKTAYAYTVSENGGYVVVKAASKTKMLVNGQLRCVLESGESKQVDLAPGDVLLVKSKHEKDGWGFVLEDYRGIGLPVLDTNRAQSFLMAYCGPFYQNGFDVRMPPEYADDLLQPFPDGRGGQVFWRFQNAFLRAYLDSSFFGQWYYATMLSFNGILQCGEAFDEPECVDYFLKNEQFLADWSEYAAYDSATFGFAPFMGHIKTKDYLDHIGTMGANFIEAYRMTGDKRYLSLIRLLQGRISHTVPRFEDGTFRRNSRKTMWADDFYMSGSFLTRLYSQMRDEDSLQDILRQLHGFVKRLYMPDERIFSHIYFWGDSEKNKIPWGRGNGWIALAMSEMLMGIPEENPAHEQIRAVFCEFCEGLAAVQDQSGMWHQILNRPDSYLESSCTVMFALAFYRGVHYGWLPTSFQKKADSALQTILERYVDENGVFYGVCMGSGCSMDPQYYLELPTIKDDNHGTGVLLMLLCEKEMMERKNDTV